MPALHGGEHFVVGHLARKIDIRVHAKEHGTTGAGAYSY